MTGMWRSNGRAFKRAAVWMLTAALVLGGVVATSPAASAALTSAGGPSQSTMSGVAEGSAVKTADLSKFQAGNIISDAAFSNRTTMSEAQIQAFLESKVPRCQAGYICLRDWYDTSRTTAADAMCGAYSGGVRERASTIIYKVAQACGVNPQVLLVMLQKEQGLVLHTWPSEWRYTIAMGQGCPDTAACDTRYHGFFNQVFGSAWQLKRYGNPPGTSAYFTWFAPGKTWNVRWHPNESCGSSPVYIQNQATASLYYYTPYQPNSAAIRAGYGEGDACSSYGNRNFYQYFTDWFGSTQRAACDQPPYEQVRGASGTMRTTAVVPARRSSYVECNEGALWLNKDFTVTVAAEWNDWYWVNVTGHMLWVQKASLKIVAPCDQPPFAQVSGASGAYATTTDVTARTAPHNECVTGSVALPPNSQVRLSAQWGDWYWVAVNGANLWVPKSSVKPYVACDQPPYSQVSGASGSFVTNAVATARVTANAECAAGAVDLAAGTVVTASAQWGDWYWVTANGAKLWVLKSSVKPYAACTQPPYEQVRGASGTATATRDTIARPGPYASCSSETAAILAGQTVTLAAQWGDWYWAKVGTRNLWVPVADVTTSTVRMMTTTAAVNLRASASLTAAILSTVPAGTSVAVIGASADWYEVQVGAQRGWLNAAYVR